MVRIVALPFSREKWIYSVSPTQQALLKAPQPGSDTLGERAQYLAQVALGKVQSSLHAQWTGLEMAPEGSIKNRLYRLAHSVLAREDVTESFLKTVPAGIEQLQVVGPAAQAVGGRRAAPPERLIRRHMRLMLRQQEDFHRCRMVTWGGLLVPVAPLAVLPFPNVPMYYAGYRAWSHYRALKGARTLLGLFSELDASQAAHMASPVTESSTEDINLRVQSSAHRCEVIADEGLDPAAKASRYCAEDEPGAVQQTLLEQAAQLYDVPDLPDYVARAHKVAFRRKQG